MFNPQQLHFFVVALLMAWSPLVLADNFSNALVSQQSNERLVNNVNSYESLETIEPRGISDLSFNAKKGVAHFQYKTVGDGKFDTNLTKIGKEVTLFTNLPESENRSKLLSLAIPTPRLPRSSLLDSGGSIKSPDQQATQKNYELSLRLMAENNSGCDENLNADIRVSDWKVWGGNYYTFNYSKSSDKNHPLYISIHEQGIGVKSINFSVSSLKDVSVKADCIFCSIYKYIYINNSGGTCFNKRSNKNRGLSVSRNGNMLQIDLERMADSQLTIKSMGKFIEVKISDVFPSSGKLILELPNIYSNEDVCVIADKWGDIYESCVMRPQVQKDSDTSISSIPIFDSSNVSNLPAVARISTIGAPDIAENGCVIPVSAEFNPPLKFEDKFTLWINGQAFFDGQVSGGELLGFQTRVRSSNSGYFSVTCSGCKEVKKYIDVKQGCYEQTEQSSHGQVRSRANNPNYRVLMSGDYPRSSFTFFGPEIKLNGWSYVRLATNPFFLIEPRNWINGKYCVTVKNNMGESQQCD